MNHNYSSWQAYTIVRFGIAIIFLFAATFKAYQLGTQSFVPSAILFSPLLVFVLVLCEFVFATLLIIGLRPDTTRKIAIAVFCLFATVSLFQIVAQEKSCGCFGNVRINPLYSLALNCTCLLTLLGFRPQETGRKFPAPQTIWIITSTIVVILTTAIVIATSSSISAIFESHNSDGLILPDQWIGKSFPIANDIDIGDQLMRGEWIIILFRHNCDECNANLPAYVERARQLAIQESIIHVAIIEVPPFGANVNRIVPAPCRFGRLSSARQWIVSTPAEITLRDGQVVHTTID